MKKRILSVILTLALVLALLPAGVLALTPVTVRIGGIDLEEGKYLPSHGTGLTDTLPAEGGYAVLNGSVLTFCDFVWEGTAYEGEEESRQAILITGNAELNLIGSSTVITGSHTALRTEADLTVTGEGSLRIYGRLNAVVAENFTMQSGAVQATAGLGGNGIAVTDNVTFIGGDLVIDADYAFYSFDYDNYDDPVISVAPAADTIVTVRRGFRGEDPLTDVYAAADTVPVYDSGENWYHRFWFTDSAAEAWPEMPAEPFDVQVAGVYVTEENCGDVLGDGTVRFDPATDTLTLDGANLSYAGRVIYAEGLDLTIEVLADSTLSSETDNAIHLDLGDLTIRGGKLDVRSGNQGIFVYGSARLIACAITVDAAQHAIYLPNGALTLEQTTAVTEGRGNIGINISGDLTIEQSKLDNTGSGDGLDASDLVIRNSEVSSVGTEDGAWLSGALEITRSNVTFVGKQNAVQVKGGAAVIEDSTVDATSQGTGGTMDIAIYAERGISIFRSRVTAVSPTGMPAIAAISGKGTVETDCGFEAEKVAAPNGTQIVTFVKKDGSYVTEVYTGTGEDLKLLFQFLALAAGQFPFEDVSASDWFYDEVKQAWENGLIDGVTETEFMPNGALTVAQTIKLAAALHQMQNFGEVTLSNGEASWYSTYVDYAVSAGVISAGYRSYSAAQMNAPISRREFVSIFYGAMDAGSYYAYNHVADNAIADVKMTDSCAAQIYAFYRAGILTGSDAAGTFHPESTIKRSEAAAILIRMYDITARQTVTLG